MALSGNKVRKQIEAAHTAVDIKEYLESDALLQRLESKAARRMFKILIVDDDNDVLAVTKMHVKGECGLTNVWTASDGYEAIELIEGFSDFDLILSDYRMPNMDGYRLYENTRKYNIPFVMITGFGSNTEIDNLKDAGVLVLPKPFDLENVRKVVMGFYIRKLRDIAYY